MDTCTTLTRRVNNLEQDKIAQSLEITKLKSRVKKLERRNKASKLQRLKKVGAAQRIETSDDTVMDDIDLEHANNVLSMQDDEGEPAELQEVVEVVTTVKLITEVVTAASATLTRKQKEDNVVKRYQALKRKPQTKAQARKNMMIYLRNVAGFKMDYFKGMTYDDIRPIFKKKFNFNVAFLMKTKEQMDEEDSRALKRLSESQDDKTAKKQKLDEEVEELKRRLQIVPNEKDDVYTEATPLTLKPKNFFDDFLLITLGAMFEKPDLQAQIWKNQRSVHGQAKVKSWKLLESCGVKIITFTTTQLILLVERRYPLTRFTLNQMLNNVRHEVEEKSKVSLELLRFIRQQHQEGVQLE
nr:hypothetical protein [Tanacetum cinerariifolium]